MLRRYFNDREGSGNETDDDTQSDDAANQDTDDTDSEDTGDSDSDNEGQSSDADGEVFYDASKVAPELRPSFKKMQATFTRRMQQASAAIEKAAAMDRLLEDPDFHELYLNRDTNNRGGGSRHTDDEDDDSGNEDSDIKTLTPKTLQKLIDQGIERATHKVRQENVAERTRQQYRESAIAFKKAHPDWQDYAHEMRAIFERNPRLSYEEAYFLAKRNEIEDENKQATNASKKRANSARKPNGLGVRDVETKSQKGKKISFRDSWEQAKKKLGYTWGK